MRMQAEYEYPNGQRGMRLFDIEGDHPSKATLDKAAEKVVPKDATVMSVGPNEGHAPYDQEIEDRLRTEAATRRQA
jgi:hypothetical protein